jgi:hypothetical protein
MILAALVAASLQAALMLADEMWFHRARGLPRWERIGHPLDSLSVGACYAVACMVPGAHASHSVVALYIGLAIFSCLFVTKDEPIHRRVCSPAECWVHGVLFVVHPVVLATVGLAWLSGHDWLVRLELALTAGVLAWQVVYWNVIRRQQHLQPAR